MRNKEKGGQGLKKSMNTGMVSQEALTHHVQVIETIKEHHQFAVNPKK